MSHKGLLWFPQSFTQSLKRRMSLKNTLYACGVTYEIVSNIPKVLLWLSFHSTVHHLTTLICSCSHFILSGLRGA